MAFSIQGGSIGQRPVNLTDLTQIQNTNFDLITADQRLNIQTKELFGSYQAAEAAETFDVHHLNSIKHDQRIFTNLLADSSAVASLFESGELQDILDTLRKTGEVNSSTIEQLLGLSTGEIGTEEGAQLVEKLMQLVGKISSLDDVAKIMSMMNEVAHLLSPNQLQIISREISQFATEEVQNADSSAEKKYIINTIMKMVRHSSVKLDTSELSGLHQQVMAQAAGEASHSDSPDKNNKEFSPKTEGTQFSGAPTHHSGLGALPNLEPEQTESVAGIQPINPAQLLFGASLGASQQNPLDIKDISKESRNQYWIDRVDQPGDAWMEDARSAAAKEIMLEMFSTVNELLLIVAEKQTEQAANDIPAIEGLGSGDLL